MKLKYLLVSPSVVRLPSVPCLKNNSQKGRTGKEVTASVKLEQLEKLNMFKRKITNYIMNWQRGRESKIL